MSPGVLIERDGDRAVLEAPLGDALAGHGSLVLVAGEAGVGKTSFTEAVARSAAEARFLRGPARPGAPAYGPLISALRDHMRAVPGGLDECGPLRGHLALLLPEL